MVKKIIIISICVAVIAISAVVLILGYNMENNQDSTIVSSDNTTKGKEINVFLSDGVGASDTP